MEFSSEFILSPSSAWPFSVCFDSSNGSSRSGRFINSIFAVTMGLHSQQAQNASSLERVLTHFVTLWCNYDKTIWHRNYTPSSLVLRCTSSPTIDHIENIPKYLPLLPYLWQCLIHLSPACHCLHSPRRHLAFDSPALRRPQQPTCQG